MKKKIFIVLFSLLGVAILAGAAYLGARLLNPEGLNSPLLGFLPGGKGGMFEKSVKLNMTKAPEVPDRAADLTGMVSQLKDNGFLLSDSAMMPGMKVGVSSEGGGSAAVTELDNQPEGEGTQTEVIITETTQIYIDVTFEGFDPSNMPDESQEIQQVVEKSTGDDITKDSAVSIWGYKRGDRMMAEFILCHKPIVFRMEK